MLRDDSYRGLISCGCLFEFSLNTGFQDAADSMELHGNRAGSFVPIGGEFFH